MAPNLIHQIEDMQALDGFCHAAAGLVGRVTRAAKVKNALSGTWLRHPLHPPLTDVPIGAWTMASLVDVVAGRSGARVSRRLVGLGVLSAIPTAASGAADWADTYGAEQRVGAVHGVCNAAATVLQTASWLARRRDHRCAGMALSGLGLGLTLGAAYLGGHLVFARGVGVSDTAFQPTVDEWTDVAAFSELPDGRPVRVAPGAVPVVLVRDGDIVHALSAVCTHAGGPLDEGKVLDDGCIRCPWHGSEFRLTDGAPTRGPASVSAPRWDVKVSEGRVRVRSAAS
ncbi:Rieske 2Fe-2S domain-containing protein [Streptomyces sp. SDT5-1]|uniref:Rieske 2Fe-2S domain-containing protein n=1 Tax=Streptomyces sp. SDT5-1 TaxID=3406418 RepID=UPI003FD20AC5